MLKVIPVREYRVLHHPDGREEKFDVDDASFDDTNIEQKYGKGAWESSDFDEPVSDEEATTWDVGEITEEGEITLDSFDTPTKAWCDYHKRKEAV